MNTRAGPSLAWCVVLGVGLVTYYQLRNQPFYYDASAYVSSAQAIREHGLFSAWPNSDFRTYGLPLFLSVALRVAAPLHVGANTAVFGIQWVLFVGAAWLASRALFRAERTRLTAFVAVAANPLLVVYTAHALTESLTLTCVLFAAAGLGLAAREARRAAAAGWLTAGAAASSCAMALRPASLLIPGCYAVAAAVSLFQGRPRRSWGAMAATAGLVLVALAAPLAPQVAINEINYDKLTPLPVYDLAGLQAAGGIRLIRYASNVSSCGTPGMEFVNPTQPKLADPVTRRVMLRYYALDWPNGPRTAALHVFSGFDPRPFLLDQHDFGIWYERVYQALTVALLFLAFAGLPAAWRGRRRPDGALRMDAVFLAAAAACALAILATSAAEYRFGMIPLTAVSLLAPVGAYRLLAFRRRSGVLLAIGYVAGIVAWIALSDWVLTTSTTWMQCS
jgi:hypothetical protein